MVLEGVNVTDCVVDDTNGILDVLEGAYYVRGGAWSNNFGVTVFAVSAYVDFAPDMMLLAASQTSAMTMGPSSYIRLPPWLPNVTVAVNPCLLRPFSVGKNKRAEEEMRRKGDAESRRP